jgi:hypothetical protein
MNLWKKSTFPTSHVTEAKKRNIVDTTDISSIEEGYVTYKDKICHVKMEFGARYLILLSAYQSCRSP